MAQHELAARTGMRQAHISRIENGLVDPKLSSVVNLARALGFELMLVPRRTLPAVIGVLRDVDRANEAAPAMAVDLLVGDREETDAP